MPEDCILEVLSPELQLKIMLQFEDLDTLSSFIRASPRMYQVFRLNKNIVLSTTALNHIHPIVQQEVIAVAGLAHLQRQSHGDEKSRRDTAEAFRRNVSSQEMYAWIGTDALEPVSIELCSLVRAVDFFVKDYTQNTLPILGQLGRSEDLEILSDYPPDSHVVHPQLSSKELERLQRAFCRFELYRRLFSRCLQDAYDGTHKCIDFPPLKVAEQAAAFFGSMPPVQITELACIRDFIFRRLKGICQHLEDQAVRTLPLEVMTFRDFDEAAMWRSPFYIFTYHAQPGREQHLEHLMSLGLPYMRRIIESTGNEQRDLFLHHIPGYVVSHFEHDFLSDTLRNHSGSLYTEELMTAACDGNSYSEHPPGWLWGHRPTTSLRPLSACDRRFKGLRDWGYVFWDSDRLQNCGILDRE